MSTHAPDLADPWRLVEFRNHFAGLAPPASFPRVAGAVHGMDEAVEYELRFGKDAEGRAAIEGWVKVRLVMLCQRCLQPVEIKIDSSFALVLVASDAEADRLPEHLEAVVVSNGPMRILDFIEDEMLLSLPSVPKHVVPCLIIPGNSPEDSADEQGSETNNPFAALAALKKH